MVLLVLLLFCACLGCLWEGVWTKYTANDVARWHAHAVGGTAVPYQTLPPPPPPPLGAPHLAHGFSGRAEKAARCNQSAAAPAKELSARGA